MRGVLKKTARGSSVATSYTRRIAGATLGATDRPLRGHSSSLAELGVHPVQFGVIMVVNVMISLITPPYGLALYLGSAVGGVTLGALVRQTWPFLVSSLTVLVLVTLVPALSLTLPRLFGFIE